jgi:membrane protease YdiL (CAAX protease family)
VEVAPWISLAAQHLYINQGFPESEAIFLAKFTFVYWLSGLGSIFALWLVLRIERPTHWKAFFLLDQTDWPGFLILLVVRGLILGLEGWLLFRWVWTPIQNMLIGMGLWTESIFPVPPRQYLLLNLIVLILISWLEIPEEIYFRGYLQPQLTARLGAFWGIVLSLLLWDLWHLGNPAMMVRRFFITLPDALLVHWRKRVWGPLILHPLGNRILVIAYLLMPDTS